MKVDFTVLGEVLDRVRATIASEATVEIYTFICFRAGRVTSFDGAVGTITTSGLDSLGDFCVPGKKFCQIVQACKGQQGEITFADSWIFVKSGQFKTKLPIYPADDFPDIAPEGNRVVLTVGAGIQEALKIATTFVEKDGDKEKITGIGFEGDLVYATDGKRVVRAKLESQASKPFTISKKAAEQIIRLGDPDFLVKCRGNLVASYGTDTEIVARFPAEAFPFTFAYQVFAQSTLKDVIELPEEFRKAVDRVRAFSEDDEGVILLTADGYHLKMSTASTEVGEASDVVPLVSPAFQVKLKGDKLGTLLSKLRPTTADITDLTQGDKRMVVFYGESYSFACAFAAMV